MRDKLELLDATALETRTKLQNSTGQVQISDSTKHHALVGIGVCIWGERGCNGLIWFIRIASNLMLVCVLVPA